MVTSRGGLSPSPALLLLGFLFLHGAPSRAVDTITDGQPLFSGQSLVSKRGKFKLGFFKPDNSSAHWYMGIWYNQISAHDIVWVANREAPITDVESFQLCISRDDGNMVILDHRKSSLVWSTNVTNIPSVPTVGIILDTGNLVLAQASNTSIVLWQSFDHLCDTWLPGGKLGRNKVTGEVDRLVAWRGYNDPAPSTFSLELDPHGTSQYLLINWDGGRQQPQQYWTSGNWSAASHIFTEVPEMTAADASHGFYYTFGYVDAGDKSYFIYDVDDDSVVARFRMDVTGQIKFLMWVEAASEWQLFWSEPKAQCDVYAVCGPFGLCTENALPFCSCPRGFRQRRPHEWLQGDYTSGCTRSAGLRCSDNKDGRFYAMGNVRLPSDARISAVGASAAGDCELACLASCSCTAYSYNGTCSLWYGGFVNLRDMSGITIGTVGGSSISIRLAASEFSSAGDRHSIGIVVVLGLVAAATIIFALVTITIITRRRRRRIIRPLRRTRQAAVQGSLVSFTYRDLQLVTNNFSEKLGGGAFGSVFKGSLSDDDDAAAASADDLVAVKKLEGDLQGEKQFRAEVSTIGTVQHVNLIRLLGFCSEGTTRRLLVYEHMPNGSLDRHLFVTSSRHCAAPLSWGTRYQLALGIARGLDYLHHKCRDHIIHCDIKPENILLDATFAPKVADFGLAKLMGRDFSRVLTTMRGTVGYLAPEWITGTAITTKADVFSYGMVLFEIISGRRNVVQRPDGTVDFFPSTAMSLLFGGDLMAAVDAQIRGDADIAEVERVCKIACWCVQDDESARPTMGTVLKLLEGLLEVNSAPPIPISFTMLADPSKYVEFFTSLPST